MCFKNLFSKPAIVVDPAGRITWLNLKKLTTQYDLENMLLDKHVPDAYHSYLSYDGWQSILGDLILPANMAVEGDFDCDDYARISSAKAVELHKVRVYEVWGYVGTEYHAWCMVVASPTKIYYYEPNAGFTRAGELFNQGDYDTKPMYWKI